jgi:hypothetical protein
LLGFVIVAAAQVSNKILGMWQLSHQVGGAPIAASGTRRIPIIGWEEIYETSPP